MTTPQHPQHMIDEAAVTCRDLAKLLNEENESLSTQRTTVVEQNIPRKTELMQQLENQLNSIHTQRDDLREDSSAPARVNALQTEMDAFQSMARKNLLMLKAAHQTRVDMINLVRQAVMATSPKAETYNASGDMNAEAPAESMVRKEV